MGSGEPTPWRARSLGAAATLAYRQGDYDQAEAYSEVRLAIWQELGDEPGVAAAFNLQASVAYDRGDYRRAVELFEEAASRRRKIGDLSNLGVCLNNVGNAARELGDLSRAEAAQREALEILRSLDDREGIAYALNSLGIVAHRRGDLAGAVRLHEEALALRRAADPRSVAASLANLGAALRDQGDLAGAAERYRESLALRWERGETFGIAESLAGLASVAALGGRATEAARFRGAFEALSREAGLRIPAHHLGDDGAFDAVHAELGAEEWTAYLGTGTTWPLERAVAEGLAFTLAAAEFTPEPAPSPTAADRPALSSREVEVLRLLVEGRTDRQIGAALGISHRTAMNHVARILGKLGVESRTAAAALAVRQGLV
jgi:ATP/maltotriose-dependent transcriptional regulator MalT